MNNTIGAWAGGIIIGTIVGGGAVYYWQQSQAPAAAPAAQEQNSVSDVQTNPYANVKVNPFQ